MNAGEYLKARIALEGNPVFTDLRMERDILEERNAALLDALRLVLHLAEAYLHNAPSHPDNAKLETVRAAIREARGRK